MTVYVPQTREQPMSTPECYRPSVKRFVRHQFRVILQLKIQRNIYPENTYVQMRFMRSRITHAKCWYQAIQYKMYTVLSPSGPARKGTVFSHTRSRPTGEQVKSNNVAAEFKIRIKPRPRIPTNEE